MDTEKSIEEAAAPCKQKMLKRITFSPNWECVIRWAYFMWYIWIIAPFNGWVFSVLLIRLSYAKGAKRFPIEMSIAKHIRKSTDYSNHIHSMFRTRPRWIKKDFNE